MNPEDRLRDLLRQEAADVHPTGDGLARIQERIARRRRGRLFLVPGAVLATAGAATAFFLLNTTQQPTKLTIEPGQTPSATAEPTPTGVPSPQVTPVVVSPTGPVLSSYSSTDKDEVVRHWLDEAGLAAEPLAHTCESCDVVPIGVGLTKVADAVLQRDDSTGTRVYRLASVQNDELRVTSPGAGEVVTSPLTVRGTVPGVDENVRVTLRTTKDLATAGAPAGGEQPWSTTLSWTDSTWTSGSLTAVTRSPRDGMISRLVALPVLRGTRAATASTYAVLRGGHVELLDSGGGTARQVTFPPSGTSDTGMAYSGGTVAWVRTRATGCHDSLNRLAIGGSATTVVADGTARIASPRLSPDAATLAWTQTPCGSEQRSLIVRTDDDRVLAVPSGMTAVVRDVRDDGAMIVHLNDVEATDAGTLGYLPPGATTLDALVPLAAEGSCYLAGAATFDPGVTAWETCDGRSRLVQFSDAGRRGAEGALVDATSITGAAAHESRQVLEVRSRAGLPTVALYASGRLTYLHDCDTAAACQSSPDW